MKKIWTLIKREYTEAVFKKSFIILTLLIPVIMIGMGIVPSVLIGLDSEEPYRLSIIDETEMIYDRLAMTLSDTLKDGSPKFLITRTARNDSLHICITSARMEVEKESIDGFIHIPPGIFEDDRMYFYARNVANFNLNQRIRSAVEQIVIEHRLEASGLDVQVVNKLTRRLDLKTFKIMKGGEQKDSGFMTEYLTTFAFVIILYITLLGYGANVMREIIQEKTARITEVLLSSANPFQLMAGKILGQGAVGLTQYFIWSVVGLGLIFFGSAVLPVSENLFRISPVVFIYFILFYVLGYILFSSLYAAVGAISGSEQEAQQVAAPIIFILIIPLMLIGFMVKNPDSTLISIISFIPVFTPIIMFMRINLSPPPAAEIWGSVVLLILTILVVIWITAKVFRVGILMYGKRPTLPEIIRWVRE